jgi:hypothetical protein
VFSAWYWGSSTFRAAVLSADPRLLTAIQAWRAGGLGFLALNAYGVLPSPFAWPAGFGDIAIGVTAPWMALVLVRQRGFARSRRFVVWNFLGILDLIVVISMGALCSGLVPGLVGNVTTAPMSQLPLVLIPAYLVPLFVMLHVTVLLQARRLASMDSDALPGHASRFDGDPNLESAPAGRRFRCSSRSSARRQVGGPSWAAIFSRKLKSFPEARSVSA